MFVAVIEVVLGNLVILWCIIVHCCTINNNRNCIFGKKQLMKSYL